MKQIRSSGSYEITIFNPLDARVEEYVTDSSLMESKQKAESIVESYNATLTTDHIAKGLSFSFSLSRVIFNSKYNNWAPNN